MRFDDYYFIEEESSQSKIDWNQYVKNNKELKYALEIMKKIEDAGFESLIVGGFVRDLLMGTPSDDIDITTDANPSDIEKIFKRVIDIGKSKDMGISVVPYKGYQFEIGTYRKDVYGDLEKGKGAEEVEIAKDFKDDSSRRDFTINALGIDADGNIIDHHGGLKDIDKKVIAAVGDADIRFKEDEVRQLRGIRFASRMDFDISPETIEAMKKHAPEIAKVSPERITKELRKMAKSGGKQFARAIEIMDDVGILQYILPEIVELKSYEHSPVHHPEKDKEGKHTILAHTLEALKSSDVKDDIVNMSILFHDIGKDQKTFFKDEKGIIHYFDHAKEGFNKIDDISIRLKFDNRTRNAIKFSVLNHMKFHDILNMKNTNIAKLMDSPYFEVLKSVALADAKSRGQLFNQKEWDEIENKLLKLKERFKDRKVIETIRKIVNGKMVMSLRSDIKPGPKLGDVIQSAMDFVLNNNIDLEKDLNKVKQFIQNVKV